MIYLLAINRHHAQTNDEAAAKALEALGYYRVDELKYKALLSACRKAERRNAARMKNAERRAGVRTEWEIETKAIAKEVIEEARAILDALN